MAAALTVIFTPDSRDDYEDALVLVTQSGRLEVRLRAANAAPAPTLPPVLELGDVLLGNTRRLQVPFTNAGGGGRFRLVPEALWPPLREQAAASGGSGNIADGGSSGAGLALARSTALATFGEAGGSGADAAGALAPFTAEPAELDLPAGAAASLAVSFTPAGLGEAQAAFLLVCDTCTVRRYVLRGRGTDVDVRLEGEDGAPLLQGSDAAGPGLPLWMGAVVPGAAAERSFRVRNATQLPLPFRWEVARLPGEGAGHSNGSGSGCGDTPVAAGHAPGLRWAPLAAGGAAAGGFSLEPSSGVLHPGERLQVTAGFAPAGMGPTAALARLVVNRAASAQWQGVVSPAQEERGAAAAAALAATLRAAPGASWGDADADADVDADAASSPGAAGATAEAGQQGGLVVAGLLLQGAGAPAALELDPPVLRVPGALVPGQRVELPLTLRNPTDAPVAFQFDAAEALGGGRLALSPSGGVVPPRGAAAATLTLQPSAAGPLLRVLRCRVRHGVCLTLQVAACVEEARVEPAPGWGGTLDLGLVRLGESAGRQLELVNLSSHGGAAWRLEQLAGGSSGGDAGGSRAQQLLQVEPPAGELPPSGSACARVACVAQVPGRHELVLQLTSGGGARALFLRASVTVVVPDVALEPCRWGGAGLEESGLRECGQRLGE
jgi:hypothetical protein